MTRLRVALLAHSVDDRGAKGSGMERACAELVRRGRGDVHFIVVSSDLPEDLRGRVEWRRVRLPRRPSILRLLVFFVAAGWKLRGVESAIVHTTGAIVPNAVSVATVHHCHAGFRWRTGRRAPRGISVTHRLNTFVYRFFAELGERLVYRPERVGCVAAVSQGVADELRHFFPRVGVVVIPNGVDVERFRPDPAARENLRLEAGAAEGEVVVLFVGGDWGCKGLELAVRAVATVRAEHAVRLWIVGEGDERRYTALAESVGAADAVRFFGRRNDVEQFYAAADLLLLPSAYETFSLVAYEAAASGLPVIATPVSGVAELVRDGGGGVLIEPTLTSIGEALRLLAADANERRRLGAAGRQWASRFDWQASADATIALYHRLATTATLSGPVRTEH